MFSRLRSKGEIGTRFVNFSFSFVLPVVILVVTSFQPGAVPRALSRRQFIPAQTLDFRDSSGMYFASLHLGTDGGVIFWVHDVAVFSVGGDMVSCPHLILYGSDGGDITVRAYSKDESFIDVLTPDGVLHGVRNKGPTGKHAPALDDLIPAEDVRLVDKRGHAFALLGLSEHGNPAMVLFDPKSHIAAFWQLFERSWPAAGDGIELFDSLGAARFAAEFRVRRCPTLTIFEKPDIHLGFYTLDPLTYQEVPAKHPLLPAGDPSQEIRWLKFPEERIITPVTLLDERGRVVWRAP